MKLSSTPNPEDRQNQAQISRRNMLLGGGALLGLAGCGAQVKNTITPSRNPDTPITESLPTGESLIPAESRMSDHLLEHPEARPILELGTRRIFQLEAANPRPNQAQLSRLVQNSVATIRYPANPNIINQHPNASAHLVSHIPDGDTGFFLDGFNNHYYIIRRQGNQLVAEWQMDVTTAAKGFSNVMDSGGTPLGPIRIGSVRQGRQGEVVSHNSTATCKVGALINSQTVGGSPSACIVGTYLTYENDANLAQRGIGSHCTNFQFDANGNPRFNLSASGGCVRHADPDLYGAVEAGLLKAGSHGFSVGKKSNLTATPPKLKATPPVNTTTTTPLPTPEVITPTPPVQTPPNVDLDTPLWG